MGERSAFYAQSFALAGESLQYIGKEVACSSSNKRHLGAEKRVGKKLGAPTAPPLFAEAGDRTEHLGMCHVELQLLP